MQFVQTRLGSLRFLEMLRLAWDSPYRMEMHLFVNDTEPTEDLTPEQLIEPVYAGYAALPVSGWTPAHFANKIAQTEADPVQFVVGSLALEETVYGYWTESPDDPGVILWAELLPVPVPLELPGQEIFIQPVYRLRTGRLKAPCLHEILFAEGGSAEGGNGTFYEDL